MRDVKIETINKDNQVDALKRLMKKKRKRKPKKHLSFDYWDRLMKERSDIDERKCR